MISAAPVMPVTTSDWPITLSPDGTLFYCRSNETLLKASLAVGHSVPYDCGSGSCGTCKAKLVDGTVETRFPSAPGLSDRDRRKGDWILMCQSEPRSPCTVRVPHLSSTALEPRPQDRMMTITGLTRHNEEMITVVGEIDCDVEFLPGQYMLFDLPGVSGRRAYSMANEPNSRRLEFIIKAKPGGNASDFLFRRLSLADAIPVDGPYGRAFLRANDNRHLVCVAGGSGLAPMLSIVRSALRKSPGRRILLVFGVRRKADVIYADVLAKIQQSHPKCRVLIALSEESTDVSWSGERGILSEVLERHVTELEGCQLYLAGSPAMIDSIMTAVVARHSFSMEDVHYDRFV